MHLLTSIILITMGIVPITNAKIEQKFVIHQRAPNPAKNIATAAVTTITHDPMTVHVGDTFTIELPSNRTTGYENIIQSIDNTMLILIEHQYKQHPHAPGMTGVGGADYFTFKALKTGQTTLKFSYIRPWQEPNTNNLTPNDLFTITVE